MIDSIATARELLEKILAFGPKTPEFTSHLQIAGEELMAAKQMISDHFGGVAAVDSSQKTVDELCAADPGLKGLVEQVEKAHGVKAEGVKGFREILTFILQNPQLITFIMSWFKPATT